MDQFAEVAIKVYFIEEEASCQSIEAIFGESEIITSENLKYNKEPSVLYIQFLEILSEALLSPTLGS